MKAKSRHPSLERLLAYAAEKGAHGPSELSAALGESEQTVSNWGARGVSKAGAIKAQYRFGCSGFWVMTGDGERKVGEPAVPAPSPKPAAYTMADAIAHAFNALPDPSVQGDAFITIMEVIKNARALSQRTPSPGQPLTSSKSAE